MKKKINFRLVIIAIIAMLTTMVGITFVYYGLFEEQIRKDLSVSAKLLKDTHYFETTDISRDKVDLSTDIDELRVTWIDCDGTVLYDNDASAVEMGNHLDRPEIKDAFADGTGESVRNSDTMNKNTFYYAVRLDNNTVLRVSTEAKSIRAVLFSATPMLCGILLVIIAVCIAISHMLTRRLIEPIEIMAKNMEDTSFDTPYKELKPFADRIRKQHMDILSAAKARQDFTANVSHELKTPLTAISGYAQLLEEDMVDGDKKIHFYQEVRKNADRLLSVINDIIELSELDRGAKESDFVEVNLYELVCESVESLRIHAEKKGIELSISGEEIEIHGNPDMLKELTENLVQNAIRYNNPGGHVSIRILRKERPTLIVKDDGIGIPASEQERVFERFYRVDKSRSKATGGTGLGLAIVKHIVELHDARITLDSAPGVGTTIQVLF